VKKTDSTQHEGNLVKYFSQGTHSLKSLWF